MDSASKKKLCWNCEAIVSKTVSNCPYCGVYLHRGDEDDDDSDSSEEEVEVEEKAEEIRLNTAHNPPTPPYRLVTPEGEQAPIPAPYMSKSTTTSKNTSKKIIPETLSKKHPQEPPPKENTTTIKYALVSLISLILGTVALLFSFLLLFFSHHGVLTLKWSADLWYVYFFLSFPLLFIGWLSLTHLKE
jgi:hypothetical protein